MGSISKLCCLGLMLLAAVHAASELDFSDKVVTLDADTFHGFTSAKDSVLVMFYAPWCGHCSTLAPDFSDAADKVAEDPGQTARFARINCDNNEELCDSQQVDGYPTLYHYRNGVRQPEVFAREIPELVSVVTGVPNSGADSGSAAAADADSDGEGSKAAAAASGSPEASFWSKMRGQENVAKLNPGNFESTLAEADKAIVMFYAPWCGHCSATRQAVADAATRLAASTDTSSKFVLGAVDCEAHPTLCEHVEAYPTLTGYPEAYSGGRSVADLVTFFGVPPEPVDEDLHNGESWTYGTHVLPVTASNWEQTMADHSAVVVMYYAPWCHHCQLTKRTYASVAEQLLDNKDIALAAVDCTDPDSTSLCDKADIEGYPTIFRYQNGEKTREHLGSRTAESINSFALGEGYTEMDTIWDETGSVIVGTPNSLPKYTSAPEQATILLLKAHWCPHCQELWPWFKAAAAAVPEVNFVSVECTHFKEICRELNVDGYPSILVFSPGVSYPYEYLSTRSEEAFIRLAKAAAAGEASPDAVPALGTAVAAEHSDDLNVWTRGVGSTTDFPGLVALFHKDDRKSTFLKGMWDKAAARAVEKDIKTRFITVDCTEGSALDGTPACENTEEFPSKHIFMVRMVDGMIVSYVDHPEANDVDALLYQAHRVEKARYAHIESKEDFRLFKKTDQDWPKPRSQPSAPAVLAVVADDEDEILHKLAIFKDPLNFSHYLGYVYQADAPELIGRPAQDKSYVIVFREGDEPEIVPAELLDADSPADLMTFLNLARVPNIFEANDLTKKLLKSWPDLPLFLLFTRADMKEENEAAKDAVRKVMADYRGKLFVGFVDGVFAPQIPSRFGFNFDSYPDLGYATGGSNPRKFRLDPDTPITEDNLRKFFDSYLDGSVEPFLLSAREPAEPKVGNVTVLVGSTYQAAVTDPTKNVFVELYDPGCMYCQDLVPRWAELADHYADDPNVVIAAMDITVNDAGVKEIERTPSVYWYPANADKSFGYLYDGDFWKTQSFIDYIEERREGPRPAAKDAAGSGDAAGDASGDEQAADSAAAAAAAAALEKAAKKAFAS